MNDRQDEGAMSHYGYRDDLAAYALGALGATEALEVEGHLSGCESCREYLRWLDPAVEMLPDSVPTLAPPKRLKRELMSAVRADLKAAERAQRESAGGRQGLLEWAWRPATALAVSLILVAGLATGYALRGGDPTESVLVEARPISPDAEAAMVATLELEGARGTLHVASLPPLPDNRVYQAWIGRDGEMVPSTPFIVRHDGTNEVAIDGSLEGADGVFITREPQGGSESPTPPVIMKAPLS